MKFIITSVFLFVSMSIAAQQYLSYNKSFEFTQPGADKWVLYDIKGSYKISYTNAVKRTGNNSLLIDGQKAKRAPDDNDAAFTRTIIPVELLKGKKKARIEAWIKTDTHKTHAGLWFNQYTQQNQYQPLNEGFTDSVHTKSGWQHVQVEIALNDSGISTEFGALLNGPGKAWFDDFELYLDDIAIEDFPPPTSKEIAWINQHAIPLLSLAPGDGNTDLDSLGKWIGNATIIGAGEPTHGTSEAGIFKFRLFKYLVENMGFNTFMLEDNLPECSLINDYILNRSNSNLNLLIKSLFRNGQTEEMLALINWMKTYNEGHAKKIQFAGMDMQSAVVALPNIQNFAQLHDKALLPGINALMQYADSLTESPIDTVNKEIRWPHIVRTLDSITSYTDSKMSSYYSTLPKDTVNRLILNLTVLKQFFPANALSWGLAYRDSCMAVNVSDFCKMFPDNKMIIWAHNMHIAKASSPGWYKQLGAWLNELFGNNYYPMALATATGKYTAWENGHTSIKSRIYKSYALHAPYPGTAEFYFQRASKKNFILSFNNDLTVSAANWLNKKNGFRGIGGSQTDNQFGDFVLPKLYNAVVFIRNTTPTHLVKDTTTQEIKK